DRHADDGDRGGVGVDGLLRARRIQKAPSQVVRSSAQVRGLRRSGFRDDAFRDELSLRIAWLDERGGDGAPPSAVRRAGVRDESGIEPGGGGAARAGVGGGWRGFRGGAAVVVVLSGVGYKIASVPWHMWCPDVYEGAPTPFTAFLSVGPKAAGFALAVRILYGAMSQSGGNDLATVVSDIPWPAVIGVISAATMTLGNFAALNQTNLKRMLAYSSIAHAGYLLMGLAAASAPGSKSIVIYLMVYLFMTLGAFLVVGAVGRLSGSESIFEYRGLSSRAPFAAVAFAIFLFSLTGLPPLAGFVGKFHL